MVVNPSFHPSTHPSISSFILIIIITFSIDIMISINVIMNITISIIIFTILLHYVSVLQGSLGEVRARVADKDQDRAVGRQIEGWTILLPMTHYSS